MVHDDATTLCSVPTRYYGSTPILLGSARLQNDIMEFYWIERNKLLLILLTITRE